MAAYTTIDDAGLYFNPLLWSGTGGSSAKTGVGFAPDFVWIKSRADSENSCLTDAARGVNKQLRSDVDEAESAGTDDLTAFGADGFTVGNGGKVNASGQTYVGWCWKAGTTSVPSGGDLTPSAVSLNATSGISIIVYTGTGDTSNTIAHGLGAVPKFMFFKNRDAAMDYVTYHEVMGNTDYMILNTTAAEAASTTRWNDTSPTTTLLTIGNTDKLNSDTVDYIGWVFADVQGYSKFGSYTGNGQTDGTFIYTGFRSAFFMIKRVDSTNNWWIVDNRRLGYNVDNNILFADLAQATDDGNYVDILSNGVKTRTTDGGVNVSGGTYSYMAFAEAPFVNSSGVPVNAR